MIIVTFAITDSQPVTTKELKAVCSHMMPPRLHVCNGLASPADAACHRPMSCEICELIRYSGTHLMPIPIVCYSPWYSFTQNVKIKSIQHKTVDNTYRSRYKIRNRKKRKYNCIREHKRNRTMLTVLTFHDIIKTIKHITFNITGRTLINH